MKTIVKVDQTNLKVWYIESEPGDCTRYSYIVLRDFDEFLFMPYHSTFTFPQRINRFMIENEDYVKELAERYNCNPCTVQECIRTIEELMES